MVRKIYKTEVVVGNIIFLNKRGEFADSALPSTEEDDIDLLGGTDFDD
ncbi:MAG: hypothetical protein Q9M97_09140 [Candidatus Gracilibacteria bacterium]|nr:hypothetical protein [Candidatus Gracilibacteria bacterium]